MCCGTGMVLPRWESIENTSEIDLDARLEHYILRARVGAAWDVS